MSPISYLYFSEFWRISRSNLTEFSQDRFYRNIDRMKIVRLNLFPLAGKKCDI